MTSDMQRDIRRFARTERPVGCWRSIWLVLTVPGLQAMAGYRLVRWLRLRRRMARLLSLPLVPCGWLVQALIRWAYDIRLDASAAIGPGLYVGHLGGVRVRACRIGEHCSIQQEVRLEPASAGCEGPRIGCRVWIGAYAQVRGPIEVGDGATIGAGAVVTKDVAAGSLVLGSPARTVQRQYDNSRFL
jgi:serine O-acetyltransferase